MARRITPRQRRARVLVVATVLSVLAIFVQQIASGSRDEKLRQLGYLDEVRPLIAESTNQGKDLINLRANASDLGKPGTRARLDQVVKETEDTLKSVKDVEPPEGADEAHSLLIATVQLRVIGARQAAKDMIAALSATSPTPIVNRLVSTGRNLIAADQTYKAFTEVVEADLTKGVAAEAVAPSVWVPEPEQWESPELTAFVNILKANSSVAPIVDVATVLVRTTPAAVGKEGEKFLLPRTGSVRLEVVVANIGNVEQKRVTVTASLQQGAEPPDVARDFVDLSPGKRKALSLRGLKVPVPGQDATLTVTIGPLPGEDSTTDNTITQVLSIHA